MACWDDGDDHCCWIDGHVCTYLEEWTVQGRRWSCRLYREQGSWLAVYQTTEYQRDVQPTMTRIGINCGEYGPTCGVCTWPH